MNSELSGKIAIVTGAGSGIGRASSILLAEHGAMVICVDINEESNRETERLISDSGSKSVSYLCDITSPHACEELAEHVLKEFGRIDILFNNAGIIRRNSVTDTEYEEWEKVLDVNLNSIFYMSKAVIPVMKDQREGSIVNTASGWGINGGKSAAAYCASKGGVILLTKSMAIDYGAYNVRVNAVCPGDTDTGMLRGEAKQLGIAYEEMLSSGQDRPLRRIGKPEDIAEAVLFLASEKSAFMTGSVTVIDGGSLAGSL